jgi:hypothetical protein
MCDTVFYTIAISHLIPLIRESLRYVYEDKSFFISLDSSGTKGCLPKESDHNFQLYRISLVGRYQDQIPTRARLMLECRAMVFEIHVI